MAFFQTKFVLFALLVAILSCLVGQGVARSLKRNQTEHESDHQKNLDPLRKIVNKANTHLRLFERFLEASQMSLTLSEYSDTPFTIFMPSDGAFEKLPLDWLNRLKQPMWAFHLKQFLLHHIHRGGLSVALLKQIKSSIDIKMMDGESIEISKQRERVRFNDVHYIAYTAASDGYAFMMDEILVPSFMEQTAFMLAPSALALRWIKYAYMTGMEHILADPTTIATFLVPSNDAFDAVDEDTIATWESSQGQERLRQVLMLHIIPDVLIVTDSLERGSVSIHKTMSQESSIHFQMLSNVLRINNAASVVKSDLVAANGIVHVIDQVLLLPTNNMQSDMSTPKSVIEAS